MYRPLIRNLAGAGFFETDERAQQRAFARTRATEEHQGFAAIDVEADAVKEFRRSP